MEMDRIFQTNRKMLFSEDFRISEAACRLNITASKLLEISKGYSHLGASRSFSCTQA